MTTDKGKTTTLCQDNSCDFVVLGGEFQEQVCSKCQCRVLEPEGAQRLCQTYLSVPPPLFHEVIKHGMPTDVNCILCRTRMVASELKGQWLHLCPGCGALLCEAGELLNVTRGHLKDTPFTELPTPILKQERNQVILYESSILPHTLVPYDPKTEPETSEIMARVARALPMTTTIVQGTYKETLKELVIYSLVVTLTTVTLGSLAAGITLSVLYGSLRRPKLFMNHITKRFALTRMPIP
jgi:hypothetical protein